MGSTAQQSPDWDVIIVGAGPAGCSTALHLVQRNPAWAGRVLVLEKAHHPRPKLCGGGVTNYGEALLRGLGLQIAVPNIPLRTAYIRFQELGWTLHGDPVFRVLRRDEFDSWLASEVRAHGMALHEGEPVIDVRRDGDCVIVVTPERTYRACVLVAADGSKGIVRRKMGIEDRTPRVARLIEVLTPEEPAARPEFTERFAVFDYSPIAQNVQGYYWDFPCFVQGQAHMNRGIFDARVRPEAPRAALKETLHAMVAERGVDLDSCELMGHPIHWFDARGVFSLPHILLVGDAAGADPLLGEGISYALAYGQIAAGAISDAFATSDFHFADYRDRVLAHPLGRSLHHRALVAGVAYRVHDVRVLRLFWRVTSAAIALGALPVRTAGDFHFPDSV